jgi:hypothetical protein
MGHPELVSVSSDLQNRDGLEIKFFQAVAVLFLPGFILSVSSSLAVGLQRSLR